MANIEGASAGKMASVGGRGGNISPLLSGILTGKFLKGGSSKSEKSGSSGKSAADWHNEEVSRRHEFERQKERYGMTMQSADNPRTKGMQLDYTGSVRGDFYQAPKTPEKPTGSVSMPSAGRTRGRQFAKPSWTSSGPSMSTPRRGSSGRQSQNPTA